MSLLSVSPLAVLGLPGGWEWAIILIIGLLLFGRRLPEVGRSIGRSIVEFKKGVKGIEDEVNSASGEGQQQEAERRRLAEQSSRNVYESPKPAESRTIPTTDEPGSTSGATPN